MMVLNIDINNIVIKKKANEEENYKIISRHFIVAYFLQKMLTIHSLNVRHVYSQEDLEEYIYSIINSVKEEVVVIPARLRNVVEESFHIFFKNESSSCEWQNIEVNDKMFFDILELFYEETLENIFEGLYEEEIELNISTELGRSFREYIAKKLIENGCVVSEVLDEIACAEDDIVIWYGGKVVLNTDTVPNRSEPLLFGSELLPCIELVVQYMHTQKCLCKKMHFPFWMEGDSLQLVLKRIDNRLIVEGKHMESGIISVVEI